MSGVGFKLPQVTAAQIASEKSKTILPLFLLTEVVAASHDPKVKHASCRVQVGPANGTPVPLGWSQGNPRQTGLFVT